MRLYVATSNRGKLRDFAHAAEGRLLAAGDDLRKAGTIRIVPLPGLAQIPPAPEDELTFEANARSKALYYASRASGLVGAWVLADDSGLEVACLGNAPGVRSARYAEDQAQAQNFPVAPASTLDERNNAALLRALADVPEECRQARYRCALALARGGQILATAEGTLEGRILTAPRGEEGFGYDPLFFLPEHNQTMAELDSTTRLEFSHRGRAFRDLLEQPPFG